MNMNDNPLRVLMVDDSEQDALLIIRELKKMDTILFMKGWKRLTQ